MEDIIREILDAKRGDEDEIEIKEQKNDLKRQKEKLVALFMERSAHMILHKSEIDAINQFLSQFVAPFRSNQLNAELLRQIVMEAEVYDIESDQLPFTHRTDLVEIMHKEETQLAKSYKIMNQK